jgi:hypothetical protein
MPVEAQTNRKTKSPACADGRQVGEHSESVHEVTVRSQFALHLSKLAEFI